MPESSVIPARAAIKNTNTPADEYVQYVRYEYEYHTYSEQVFTSKKMFSTMYKIFQIVTYRGLAISYYCIREKHRRNGLGIVLHSGLKGLSRYMM